MKELQKMLQKQKKNENEEKEEKLERVETIGKIITSNPISTIIYYINTH